jgi:hypothetical protein
MTVKVSVGQCGLMYDNAGQCRTVQDSAEQCRTVLDGAGHYRKVLDYADSAELGVSAEHETVTFTDK